MKFWKKNVAMLVSFMLVISLFGINVVAETISGNDDAAPKIETVSENDSVGTQQEIGEIEPGTLTEQVEEIASEGISLSGMRVYAVWIGGASGNVKGDCVLVESGGEYLLMDIGSPESYVSVKAFLQQLGVTKLSLYYSHTHKDHTGGLDANLGYESLLRDFEVDKVYVPDESLSGVMDHSYHYGKFASVYSSVYPAKDVNQQIVKLKVGSTFSIGSSKATVIGPVDINQLTEPVDPTNKNAKDVDNYENNLSLVTQITCDGKTFLTAGDCLEEEEQLLVKKYGKSLKADLFKMNHHGWSSGNTAEFLALVKPTYTFGCTTGDSGLMEVKSGLRYRKTRNTKRLVNKTGVAISTGEEGDSLKFDTSTGNLLAYRMKQATVPLAGWVTIQGGENEKQMTDTYYIQANGLPLTGFQELDGKLYDFGTGGCVQKGSYKANEKGEYVYSGWVKYEQADGSYEMRYFKEDTGEIVRGLLTLGNTTYALDEQSGVRLKGICKIKGDLYFASNEGIVKKNELVNSGLCYAGADGKLATGFVKVNGKTYYFDENGVKVKPSASSPIVEVNGKYYYIGTDGSVKSGISVSIGGVVYQFDKNGKLINVPKVEGVSISQIKAKSKSIEVRWKKKSSVQGYEIYISTSKKTGFKAVKTMNKKTTTKATIKKLKSKKTYYVKMRSYKKLGGSKIYSKYSKVKKITVK